MASTLRIEMGLCGLMLLACGGSEAPTTPAATEPAPKAVVAEVAQAPAAPKGPPPPSIQENTFRLALEADPAYAADKQEQFHVVLTALGGYHVNPDYPIRVDFTAPEALKLGKNSLGKADAAQFGDEAARFDVAFSAQPGSHAIEALVDFAVCTKETCVPDQRTVALNLNVK